ncbi:hypothetical protein HanPSC8_Chr11g0467111 [Helianthus annuus]|nr:hypothetical protein HanPSC8_Chr11g0467111 [Helianthus annuus]
MDNTGPDRRHEVEGNVMHIMKALPSHRAPAQSLIEANSLQLLFEMVANGSLILSSRYKEGRVPLHNIQLHRHAMTVSFELNELMYRHRTGSIPDWYQKTKCRYLIVTENQVGSRNLVPVLGSELLKAI